MDLSKVILDKNLLKKKLLFTKNVSTERQTEMPFNLKKKKKKILSQKKNHLLRKRVFKLMVH